LQMKACVSMVVKGDQEGAFRLQMKACVSMVVKGDQEGASRLRIEACVSKLSARPLADRRQI